MVHQPHEVNETAARSGAAHTGGNMVTSDSGNENTFQFRDTLIRLHNGIYILSVDDDGERNAMPVSWVSQVSFDPPIVMVAVHPSRYTHHMLESAGSFAINLLRRDQAELVPRFKLKGEDRPKKFEGLKIAAGVTGAPLLEDAAGYIECEIVKVYDPGDHTLFFGRVVDARLNDPDAAVLSVDQYGKSYG